MTMRSQRRIIPARAGFTLRFMCGMEVGGDHPRSRGVYLWVSSSPVLAVGSSPLARGLRSERCEHTDASRIIPARAGFTRGWPFVFRLGGDHPRSRGVYSRRVRVFSIGIGSSPLARGLHFGNLLSRNGVRIIPARAGFTRGAAPPPGGEKDHPRSRGVYPGSGPATRR